MVLQLCSSLCIRILCLSTSWHKHFVYLIQFLLTMKSIKYQIRLLKSSVILNTRTWILSLFYFLIGIIYIMLPAIPVSILPLAVKALIIPILIILFKVSVRNENTISHWLIFAALFFSWAGDVALGDHLSSGNHVYAGTCMLSAHTCTLRHSFLPDYGKESASKKVYLFSYSVIIIWTRAAVYFI